LDHRCGLIRAGKTSRERVLPIPNDAGAALARYLREARPVSAERAVFLSHLPPHKPLRTGGLANLVNHLLRQAGIGAPCSGVYVLRHTLATTMVRGGATFKEVADILGHSSLTTTGIYAKLDLQALAQVALPGREVRDDCGFIALGRGGVPQVAPLARLPDTADRTQSTRTLEYVEAKGFSWPIHTPTILDWIGASTAHCGPPGRRMRLIHARCFRLLTIRSMGIINPCSSGIRTVRGK